MICKAALLLFRDNGGARELLFVRAAGKPFFVFPGGKQEAGETIDHALQRELLEELGTAAATVKKLGVVTGRTPDGRDMEMHLYSGELLGGPQAQSEIEEIAWLSREDVAAKTNQMTPMTLDRVIPFLSDRNIW